MKRQSKFASTVLVLFAATTVPSVVQAEDDNVYDGKSYPGSMCLPMDSSVLSHRVASIYYNTSGSTAYVSCPVIQDSWTSTAGLSFGGMVIENVAGGTFSCTQNAYNSHGYWLSSRSFSTTTTGSPFSQFFWGSSSYLPTTGNWGYITIDCSVPPYGHIKGYQVQERA